MWSAFVPLGRAEEFNDWETKSDGFREAQIDIAAHTDGRLPAFTSIILLSLTRPVAQAKGHEGLPNRRNHIRDVAMPRPQLRYLAESSAL
jgi:hypothetical protein